MMLAAVWGVSFTANLTPDNETGLGKWTLRNFRDTLRTGRHMGQGRPILPPMPIPCTSTSPMRTWNDLWLPAFHSGRTKSSARATAGRDTDCGQ